MNENTVVIHLSETKLLQLQERIDNGTYLVSAEAIADDLVEAMFAGTDIYEEMLASEAA